MTDQNVWQALSDEVMRTLLPSQQARAREQVGPMVLALATMADKQPGLAELYDGYATIFEGFAQRAKDVQGLLALLLEAADDEQAADARWLMDALLSDYDCATWNAMSFRLALMRIGDRAGQGH